MTEPNLARMNPARRVSAPLAAFVLSLGLVAGLAEGQVTGADNDFSTPGAGQSTVPVRVGADGARTPGRSGPPAGRVAPPKYREAFNPMPFQRGFDPQPFRRPVDQIPGLIPPCPIIVRPVYPCPPVYRPIVIDPCDRVIAGGDRCRDYRRDRCGPRRISGSSIEIGGGYHGDQWNIRGRISLGQYAEVGGCGPSGRDPLRVIEAARAGAPIVDIGYDEWVLGDRWWPYGGYPMITTDLSVRVGDAPKFDDSVVGAAPRMRTQMIASRVRSIEQELQEPSLVALAREAVANGRAGDAATTLRKELAREPDNAAVMRQFAVTLIQAGKIADGVSVLRSAYRIDPGLADVAVTAAEIGLSDAQLRDLLTRVVGFANRTRDASAWLAVAALMQAEGRINVARRMVDRALAAGLETDLHAAFRAGLDRVPVDTGSE